jgi:hypothetical protein
MRPSPEFDVAGSAVAACVPARDQRGGSVYLRRAPEWCGRGARRRPAVNSQGPVDLTAARSVTNGRGGGIEWTIKDGIPWRVPTLMRDVLDMVEKARAELRAKSRSGTTTSQP